MDVICENKNQYTFTWQIENIIFNQIFNLLDEKELTSPLFKAENLEQTSWYLTIEDKSDCRDRTRKLSCYLVRHLENETDEIRIRCQLKASSVNKCVSINMEESSMVYQFGTERSSHFFGEITFPKDSLESEELIIIKCQMKGIFCVENPISLSSRVRTEANIFQWCPQSLSETKLLSVKRDIQYEVFFTITRTYEDVKRVSITIRKSDSSSSIKCYTQCAVSVKCQGSLEKYEETSEMLLNPFSENDIFDFALTYMQRSWDKWYSVKNFTIDGVILTSTIIDEHSSTGGRKPSEIISDHRLDTTDILRRDQLRMFENRMHSDVKLQIGSDSFPAHKDILASRSPVFSAMFSGETIENQSGIVKITDMDANTLNSLLKYMYATVIDNLNYENALKLLVAADKYQIPSLKEVCSNYLLDSLTDENVCEVLSVADMLSYLELKTSVMEYMKEHASEVLTSDGWKQLLETNANVAGEMLSVISKNIKVALNKN